MPNSRPFIRFWMEIGRLGRMLVPLFLWQHGLIRAPMFYISAYLESNREAYYDGLLAISRDGDWTGWCQFFLQAVQAQAEDNLGRTQGIIELYERMKVRVDELTHSRYAIRAVDYLFNRPIFQSTEFIRASEIPEPTARRILNLLINAEILEVVFAGRGRRANIYVFQNF